MENETRTLSPLHAACKYTQFLVSDLFIIFSNETPDLVVELIRKGADVNARGLEGITPLIFAVFLDKADCVTALVARGADLDLEMRPGYTAFMFAAICGNIPLLRLLAKSGANIHKRDKMGMTALCLAIGVEKVEAVRVMVQELGVSIDPISKIVSVLSKDPGLIKELASLGAEFTTESLEQAAAIHSVDSEVVKTLIELGVAVPGISLSKFLELKFNLDKFFERKNLSAEDIRNPKYYIPIAKKLGQLHTVKPELGRFPTGILTAMVML